MAIYTMGITLGGGMAFLIGGSVVAVLWSLLSNRRTDVPP
jgi:hypothetical protein